MFQEDVAPASLTVGLSVKAKWPNLKGELGRVTLPEIFESGLAQAADRPFLGHRPRRGSNGQLFADTYVWQTYRDVNKRRQDVGSGLEAMFRTGRLKGGAEFQGVGIWSINRPGSRRPFSP